MSTGLVAALWLVLWTGCCTVLAQGHMFSNDPKRLRELVVPALGLAFAAVLLREPQIAFTEGTAGIMLLTAGNVDARTGYLFDTATLPCAAICVAAVIAGNAAGSALATVLVVVGPLAALALLSRGTWIGWGDVKACFSLAVAFGPLEAPLALFLASLSGLLSAAVTRERGGIPFGPHLARGATLSLILAPLACS